MACIDANRPTRRSMPCCAILHSTLWVSQPHPPPCRHVLVMCWSHGCATTTLYECECHAARYTHVGAGSKGGCTVHAPSRASRTASSTSHCRFSASPSRSPRRSASSRRMHGRCGIGATLILKLYASKTTCDTPAHECNTFPCRTTGLRLTEAAPRRPLVPATAPRTNRICAGGGSIVCYSLVPTRLRCRMHTGGCSPHSRVLTPCRISSTRSHVPNRFDISEKSPTGAVRHCLSRLARFAASAQWHRRRIIECYRTAEREPL